MPVYVLGPEVLESLTRGTVDGALLSHPSVTDYDLQHHVKYATLGENFGSAVTAHMINGKKFEALPADIRRIFETAGDEITRKSCEAIDAEALYSIERIKQAGLTYVKLPAEDHANTVQMLSGIGQQWANDLDSRRKAGTRVLTAFRKALERVRLEDTQKTTKAQDWSWPK